MKIYQDEHGTINYDPEGLGLSLWDKQGEFVAYIGASVLRQIVDKVQEIEKHRVDVYA